MKALHKVRVEHKTQIPKTTMFIIFINFDKFKALGKFMFKVEMRFQNRVKILGYFVEI
jgi:hypothetical protein